MKVLPVLFNFCYFYSCLLVPICLALIFREDDTLSTDLQVKRLPFWGRVSREPGSITCLAGFAPGHAPPAQLSPAPPRPQDYTSQAPLRGERGRSFQQPVGTRGPRRRRDVMAAWGERLAGVRGVLLDISGVLYDGGEGGGAPIAGSVEALARVVGDDSHIVPRGSGQLAPVTRLLQTTHDGAPRYGTHREHIADAELGLLATAHELASVDARGGDEHLCPLLKTAWIPEDHLGKGRAAARVVDDVLHDTLGAAMLLGNVHGAQRRGVLSVLHLHAERGAGALPLPTDPAAHGSSLLRSAAERAHPMLI
nr:phospholysine phosphohistidine inorganic pyrophosphate phosphatase isoform X6 [Kogia breviceps]